MTVSEKSLDELLDDLSTPVKSFVLTAAMSMAILGKCTQIATTSILNAQTADGLCALSAASQLTIQPSSLKRLPISTKDTILDMTPIGAVSVFSGWNQTVKHALSVMLSL